MSERRTRRRRSDDVRWLLMMIVALIAAYAAYQAHTAAERANSTVVNQTVNRASNVAVWCGAINRQAAELTGYVAVFSRTDRQIPLLHLSVLPCAKLESATRASTRP